MYNICAILNLLKRQKIVLHLIRGNVWQNGFQKWRKARWNNGRKSKKANMEWMTGKLVAAKTENKDAKTGGRKRLEAKQVLLAPSSWSPSSLSVPGGPQTSGTSVCLRISVHLWPSLTVPGGHRPEQEEAGRPPGSDFLHFLSANHNLYSHLHVSLFLLLSCGTHL